LSELIDLAILGLPFDIIAFSFVYVAKIWIAFSRGTLHKHAIKIIFSDECISLSDRFLRVYVLGGEEPNASNDVGDDEDNDDQPHDSNCVHDDVLLLHSIRSSAGIEVGLHKSFES
jgi:hypothetical protein